MPFIPGPTIRYVSTGHRVAGAYGLMRKHQHTLLQDTSISYASTGHRLALLALEDFEKYLWEPYATSEPRIGARTDDDQTRTLTAARTQTCTVRRSADASLTPFRLRAGHGRRQNRTLRRGSVGREEGR
eukprot:1464704-Rhodomonas_salina.2